MNGSEQEIETILRNPPRVKVPAGLRERLIADLPAASGFERTNSLHTAPAGWLRRWLPLLLPGAVALGSGIMLTMQRLEISDLKSSVRSLEAVEKPATLSVQSRTAAAAAAAPLADSTLPNDELTRLRTNAKSLRAEVAGLESLAAENQKLRQELAKPAPIAGLSEDEAKALQDAKDRAERIQCVNHLKQIGLAARVWALDNNDKIAPDFLTMSNELSTPKILVCPGDSAHAAAESWNAFSAANSSYEYFPNDGKVDQNSEKVLTRCPIHGSIGLLDGSVQVSVMKNHPEYVVRGDDGQLYYHVPAQPEPANPQTNDSKSP